MSDLIYHPKSRAAEYSRDGLACNLFTGCAMQCRYCFCPIIMKTDRESFGVAKPRAGDFLGNLEREAAKKQRAGISGQVMLSFVGDVYQQLEEELCLTRQTIQILHHYGFSVCTLTKGGTRALRDLDLFGKDDAFAVTLTCIDDEESLKWEPGAALPEDRINAIRAFHEAGVPTWVSFEPVVNPDAVYKLIQLTHDVVGHYKIGRMNYHDHAKTINWQDFAIRVTGMLDAYRKPYYIKHDLLPFLPPSQRDRLDNGWNWQKG